MCNRFVSSSRRYFPARTFGVFFTKTVPSPSVPLRSEISVGHGLPLRRHELPDAQGTLCRTGKCARPSSLAHHVLIRGTDRVRRRPVTYGQNGPPRTPFVPPSSRGDAFSSLCFFGTFRDRYRSRVPWAPNAAANLAGGAVLLGRRPAIVESPFQLPLPAVVNRSVRLQLVSGESTETDGVFRDTSKILVIGRDEPKGGGHGDVTPPLTTRLDFQSADLRINFKEQFINTLLLSLKQKFSISNPSRQLLHPSVRSSLAIGTRYSKSDQRTLAREQIYTSK